MLYSSAVTLVIAFLAYNYSQSSRLPRTTSWWMDTLKPPIRNVTKVGALNRLMFSLRQLRATTSTNHEPRWRWTRRQKTTFAFRTVSDLNENWADKRSLGRWLYPSVYPYPPTAAATHPTSHTIHSACIRCSSTLHPWCMVAWIRVRPTTISVGAVYGCRAVAPNLFILETPFECLSISCAVSINVSRVE